MKNKLKLQKKWIAVLMMSALALLPFSKASSKDRTLSNGFSIKASFGFPSSNFGTPGEMPDDFDYGMMSGLEIGNRWYFSPTETWGVGLMVNWFDVSVVSGESKDFDAFNLEMAFLEFGPVGTYALNEDMALDAYYNARPTSSFMFVVEDDIVYAFVGSGFTHAVGAAFRWKALSLGIESVFGKVDSDTFYEDGEEVDVDWNETIGSNRFRLTLGVKF